MEQLDVFDCSNVLIASYFADDRECAHENREHTLIYQCSGRLEIEEPNTRSAADSNRLQTRESELAPLAEK